MDGHVFITNMLKAISKDEKLMPEISMAELAMVLFNGKPTKELALIKRLIGLRKEYGLDYVTVLPSQSKPPTVRFWKIKEIKALPEAIDGRNNN